MSQPTVLAGNTDQADHSGGNDRAEWEASLQVLLADHRAAVQDVLVKHCKLATDTIVQLTMDFRRRASGHNVCADAEIKASLPVDEPIVDNHRPDTDKPPSCVDADIRDPLSVEQPTVDIAQSSNVAGGACAEINVPSHVEKPPADIDHAQDGEEAEALGQHMGRMPNNLQVSTQGMATDVAGMETEIMKPRPEDAGLHPQVVTFPIFEEQRADAKPGSSSRSTISTMTRTSLESPKSGTSTKSLQSSARRTKAHNFAAVHPTEPLGRTAKAGPSQEVTTKSGVSSKGVNYAVDVPEDHDVHRFSLAHSDSEPTRGSTDAGGFFFADTLKCPKTAKAKNGSDNHDIHNGSSVKTRAMKSFGRRQAAPVFVDVEAIKAKLRKEMSKPEYSVTEYYHEHGVFRNVATSKYFEALTLLVITANALWIAVDADLNDEPMLPFARLEFQIADHFFCGYFTLEWAIRFMAFRYKRDTIKDPWLVFDSFLCLMMICETWIVSFSFIFFNVRDSAELPINASILKAFRLLRLIRMGRILRLLKALPELMVLIKGMLAATRAVSCTILLLVLIVYVFAIIFRQITDGTTLGETHFTSVPATMKLLIIHGTIPDLADLTNDISDANPFYALIFMVFVLVVTLTVMNMLVGVLVTVVSAVATLEKEGLVMHFVREHLTTILRSVRDPNASHDEVSKEDFELLLQRPDAIHAFGMMGVDVLGLVDLEDFIFRESSRIGFADFMELVMQLRGSNAATVKDIVDLRKFIIIEVKSQIEHAVYGGASQEDHHRENLKHLVGEAHSRVSHITRKTQGNLFSFGKSPFASANLGMISESCSSESLESHSVTASTPFKNGAGNFKS